jgi:uncharacterized protein with PIN domain
MKNHNLFKAFPESDEHWTEQHWRDLLDVLIAENIISWREITSLALGSLNPSQVGTSLASNPNFQRHFPPRKTWEAVRSWHFTQEGRCADCNTRLELQADHTVPKEIVQAVGATFAHLTPSTLASGHARYVREIGIAFSTKLAAVGYNNLPARLLELLRDDLIAALALSHSDKQLNAVADRLENMTLRCRRCNVVRRPSHAQGGKTFLTAETGLMWLLFVKRPATYESFAAMCRGYGLTMADIRFQEAWAMARWLARSGI